LGLGAILEILIIVSFCKILNLKWWKGDLPLEPDDKVDLGLSGDVEVTGLPGLSL
jgi:hypothetical protein